MEYIFERQINYYETDRMGITHHSNYIRFMEEARCKFLEKINLPYDELEAKKIMIPVLEAKCKYKHSSTFGDEILIKTKVANFTGVQLTMSYDITNKKTGDLLATGETRHCFTNSDLKPINLKKYDLNAFNILVNCVLSRETS